MGVSYTELFSEVCAPLAQFGSASAATEQNSGYVDVSKYGRIAVVLHAIQVTTSLDVDIEVANSDAGLNVHTLKSATQMDSEADGDIIVLEIRGDELGYIADADGQDYRYLNVEVTPVGAATFSCVVYGLTPRYAEIDQTLWDEVVT